MWTKANRWVRFNEVEDVEDAKVLTFFQQAVTFWPPALIDKLLPAVISSEAAPAYIGIDLEWSDPQSLSQWVFG